jgi:hypothetical protein
MRRWAGLGISRSQLGSLILIAFCSPALSRSVNAQQRNYDLRFAFSMSFHSFHVDQTDLVYTDTQAHWIPAISWRLTKVAEMRGPFELLLEGEFLLSNVARTVEGWEFPKATLTGFQGFAGPLANLGRLAIYGAVGANLTRVGEATIDRSGSSLNIVYVGNGGLSTLWAKHMNHIGGGNPSSVRPTIPRWSETSFGVLGGFSWWLFGDESASIRLAVDYVALKRSSLHHNVRVGLQLSEAAYTGPDISRLIRGVR